MSIWLRQLIAASEMIGGIFALVAVFSAGRVGGHGVGEVILLAALGTVAVTAGIQLWRDRLVGYRMSAVVQAIQMLHLQSAVLVYRVVLGIQLAVWVRQGGRVSFFPGLGGVFHIAGGAETWLFGVNLWAVAAFLVLEAKPARTIGGAAAVVPSAPPIADTDAEWGSRPGT